LSSKRLRFAAGAAIVRAMPRPPDPDDRKARLAAALRANLRRRKAAATAADPPDDGAGKAPQES
jgi:hypothetical protein